jgi:transcriptional regulator with XRE-family HTH domain
MQTRLKQLRIQKKISQVKLAMELNMSQNSISRYETGEREADYKTLIKIADYFDVSLDYMLYRTDTPEINRTADSSKK